MRRSVVGQLAAEPAANLEAYRAAHEAAHEDAPPAAQLDALSQCEPHIGSVLLAEYHRGSFELALLRSEKKKSAPPNADSPARCKVRDASNRHARSTCWPQTRNATPQKMYTCDVRATVKCESTKEKKT